MKDERFGDLTADFQNRIERAGWILEDHRDPFAAHAFEHATRSAEYLLSVDAHRTGNGCLARQQTECCKPCDRFAAAGFADKADRLATADSEIDAVQHLDPVESNLQVAQFHKVVGNHRSASPFQQ
ncbi:hypothetical protein D3C71_1704100 [compost metagenome]